MIDEHRIREAQRHARDTAVALATLAEQYRALVDELPEFAADPIRGRANLHALAAECGRTGDGCHDARRYLQGLARHAADAVSEVTAELEPESQPEPIEGPMPTLLTRIKAAFFVLAALVALIYGADAGGLLKFEGANILPDPVRKWIAFGGILAGILGISPLGRMFFKDPENPLPPVLKPKAPPSPPDP